MSIHPHLWFVLQCVAMQHKPQRIDRYIFTINIVYIRVDTYRRTLYMWIYRHRYVGNLDRYVDMFISTSTYLCLYIHIYISTSIYIYTYTNTYT